MAANSFVLVILLVIPHVFHIGRAATLRTPFCQHTLSRPHCPKLPTYDAFDISIYGGRWFEIGSTANFKNLQEAGGICVVANYTLLQAPAPGVGAVIGVENTLYSLGADTRNVSQVVVSLGTGNICSNAFSICAQVDQASSTSSLALGIDLVSNMSHAIKGKYPNLAESLTIASIGIKTSMSAVEISLDRLSNAMSRIQILNGQLGQGQGNATAHVAFLVQKVAESNGTTAAISKAVQAIKFGRTRIQKVAAELSLTGDDGGSSKLDQAAALISAAEAAISEQVTQIQITLGKLIGISNLFLTPDLGQKGYKSKIVGTGNQSASFAGKLEISFPGFQPGQYWILAVEGAADDGGYAATLVYGCNESPGGGIQEILFVLSRTPTLSKDSVQKLLSKGADLGVTGSCSTPFLRTVQDASCGNPPDFPPYYSIT